MSTLSPSLPPTRAFRATLTRFTTAFTFTLTLGCTADALAPGDPGDPGTTPDNGQAYQVSGIVLDMQGRPVPGARIIIDNTIFYNSAVTGESDTNGRYRLRVPDGSWRAHARMLRDYNGRTYAFELDPDNASSFAGIDGATRNFRWKLTGPAPPYMGQLHYGGTVDLLNDPMADFYDIENVEFTFTPVGPLIDGNAGQSFTARSGAARTDTYSKIVDVPIGRYRVTARHVPAGGTPRALRIRVEATGSFASSVVADFLPEQMSCRNCMRLEITP